MITLNNLRNFTTIRKKVKRVGRGPGSGVGKTCGRGEKGAHARAGSKRRAGYEGGQMRLHMKMPTRGFSNVRFRKAPHAINLLQIESFYSDGEVVNVTTLRERGLIAGKTFGVKILSDGQLTKKVTIEANALSAAARTKLQEANIKVKLV